MIDHAAGSLAPPGLAGDLPGRHARLREGLAARDLTWLLAVRDESVSYLSGYVSTTFRMHSRPVVALLGPDALHVIAAETEVDSVRLRVPGVVAHSYVEMDPPVDGLPDGHLQFAPHAARVIAELINGTPGRVGVDGLDAAWPPVGQLTRLMPRLAAETVDASELVWQCRTYKSAWELDRMQHSAEILRQVFDVMPDRIRPGMTEREISRAFSIAQLEFGAHEVGPHGSVGRMHHGLFGGPTDAVWQRDDLLYLDGAPIVDGYWADFCRTYAARPVTPTERAGYARARAGLEAAVPMIKAGVAASGVGAAIQSAMRTDPAEVGFGRFGHGIGLHVPEPPSLHPDDPTEFVLGSTLCVEPTVQHGGINYVVEETYQVTDVGLTPISPAAPPGIIQL
ncbi:M24 family metallopeptidase [Microlunatus sp. GCM10028923]|uniref:M24 family metallopeptidase n=1 Tax=Microlunatus sp. GCM10028923 TaxID=3273400 RepID=UPI003617A60E